MSTVVNSESQIHCPKLRMNTELKNNQASNDAPMKSIMFFIQIMRHDRYVK